MNLERCEGGISGVADKGIGANSKLDGCGDVTDAGWDEEFDFGNKVAVSVEDLNKGRW